MTSVLPDVDTIAHLDWQHEVPCESVCCWTPGSPAAWRVTTCCGCVGLLCDPCKRYVESKITMRGNEVHRRRCLICKTLIVTRIRDLYRSFERLP